MADQFGDPRRVVVAGKARAGAGDGPGLDHPATHRHQPLGRGAGQRPASAGEQAGKWRRVGLAQACIQRGRIGRGVKTRAPAAGQVHLEHIAGAQVVEDVLDPVDEPLRPVLQQRRRRLPGRQRRQRGGRIPVGDDRGQLVRLPGLGHRHAPAAGAIAQHRGRATQGQRLRAPPGGPARQFQHRFDLGGQFVIQQQRPATAERPRRCRVLRQAQRPPLRVQRLQEAAGQDRAVQVAQHPVGIQGQATAIAGQQQVPAPLGGAGSDRFQQQRVTRRRQPVQGQQVGVCGERMGAEHGRPRPGPGQARLNTRVPLVPPKPKPLDMATSTFAWRATLGT